MLDASALPDKRLRAQLVSIATSKADTEFPRLLRAAGRAFMSLFHGLTTIWEKGTEAAKRHHGATTFIYIQAFNTLLDVISSNCNLIAQLNAQQEPPSTTTTKKSEPSKTKFGMKPRIAQELSSLLLALLSHLTPSRQSTHTALFEGMMYLLLERTGRRLYLLTFNRERGLTIEEEMIDGNPSPAAEIGTIEHQGISLEVKFLVGLLERGMSLAPGFLGSVSGVQSGTKASRGGATAGSKQNSKGTGGTSLTFSAKQMLQRTLVECMFGSTTTNVEDEDTEGEDDLGGGGGGRSGGSGKVGNNEFIELLRKPMLVGPLPQVPRVEEVDVPEWFTGEVWRLVGWDVLSWDGDF
jgi:hypothetical protein